MQSSSIINMLPVCKCKLFLTQIYLAVCTYMERTTVAKSHFKHTYSAVFLFFILFFPFSDIQMMSEIRMAPLWYSCLAIFWVSWIFICLSIMPRQHILCVRNWKVIKLAPDINWKLVFWRKIPPCQLVSPF